MDAKTDYSTQQNNQHIVEGEIETSDYKNSLSEFTYTKPAILRIFKKYFRLKRGIITAKGLQKEIK